MQIKTIILAGLLSFANVVQAEVIELTPNNTVTLRGPIDESMSGSLVSKVHAVSYGRISILTEPSPVYLFLDSPGGSIAAGLDIIANLKTVKNLKTVSLFAASMASGIVEALPGERLGTENSILMFHRAAGSVSGEFETGNLETRLDLWKNIVRKMEQTNASRMGISLQSYKQSVLNEMWIHGEDNISKKSLDRIVSFRCSKELLEKVDTVTVNTMFGPIKVRFSGCPLLTYPVGFGDQASARIFNQTYTLVSKKFSFGHKL